MPLRAGQREAVGRQEGSSRAWQGPPECPVEAMEVSNCVTPAADSRNQAPRVSRARLVPALLLSPSCRDCTSSSSSPLPTAVLWTTLLSPTPSISDVPIPSLFTPITVCLPLSIHTTHATHISFLFPPFLFHPCHFSVIQLASGQG